MHSADRTTRRDFLETVATGLTLVAGCGDSGTLDDQIPAERQRPVPAPAGASCPAPASGTVVGPLSGDVGLNEVKQVPGTALWVCRDDRGLFALDLHCTHAGCIVNFLSDHASWLCPCHASRYAFDGTVTGGPALRSLARYAVCPMQDGSTLIDTTKKI